MSTQLCQNFQASGADDLTDSALLEPGQFSERTWSPS